MTRVHDMGGRFGDGPVIPEAEDIKFHADWHPRALVLTLAAGSLGAWNLDMSRRARESLPPSEYARFSYYEKWLAAMAELLVEQNLVSRSELAGAISDQAPLAENALAAHRVRAVFSLGSPADRPEKNLPLFALGDLVRTRRISASQIVDSGHTRLPAYVAGATGRIVRLHGTHVLPDSNAHGLGEAPEPLYAVSFAASELWSRPEHARDEVVVDLWQSYLEPDQ